jgi:neutral ceramidase
MRSCNAQSRICRPVHASDGGKHSELRLGTTIATMCARTLCLASLCLAVLSCTPLPAVAQTETASATAAKVFRAGAAVSNITPWLGDKITGRGSNTPPAAHIHDQLHARALVLDDGETKLVFVTIDNLGATRDVYDEAKRQIHEKTGIPPERMLMSSTHTHSAVNARKGPRDGRFEPTLDEYQAFVARRICDAVRIAINNLAPARIGWGVGEVPQHVHNRRWHMKPGTPLPNPFGGQDKVKMNPGVGNPDLVKPAGPTDPQVSFLAVQSPEGRPIALLANYSVHYVGGFPRDHISADYFGVFADRIQELLGADRQDPPFVGIMTNGTSGDVISTNARGPANTKVPYEKMRVVANDLAQEVLRVYRTVRFQDWVRLQSAHSELTLQVRHPSPEMLANARKLRATPRAQSTASDREWDYAGRILSLAADWPKEIDVPLQVLRIGELGIAAIPFEVFAETGLEIKKRSPFKPTFTIELANGSFGYLPTPEQHESGGYETWLGTNRVEIEASRKITERLLQMFGGLE